MSYCYKYQRYSPSFYNSEIGSPIIRIIMETSDSYSELSPVYKVVFDIPSRRVFYNGKLNTKFIGVREGIIPSFYEELLVDLFDSSSFFSMNAEYVTGQMDLSVTKITVILDTGKSKTVVFDAYAKPAILTAIKLTIDDVTNKVTWFN